MKKLLLLLNNWNRNHFLIPIFFFLLSISTQAQYATQLTVAQDGSAEFTTIQAAIDNTKSFPDKPITIVIKQGIYNEKVRVYPWNTNLSLVGEDKGNTIMTYADHFKKIDKGRNSTFHTSTLSVEANDVKIKNLTIINSAGDIGQAIAVSVSGDRCVFENCDIKGYQDTLYCTGEQSRQYFVKCDIEGTTDFIFGNATVLFEACIIHSKSNSYITAASTTEGQKFGLVFIKCKLTAANGVDKVYLGRPWRAFAKTVFIDCDYGNHIAAEGWKEWSNKDDLETTYYAEYTKANTKNRVGWSKQLKKRTAKKYKKSKIFRRWKPQV